MRYKVLFDNVLIKLIEEEESTGIILSSDYQNNLRGVVVESGNGIAKENNARTPMEVHRDMIVWFSKIDAREVEIEGEKHYILNQNDILLIEQ